MFNSSNDFDTLLSQRDQAKATYENCLRDQGPLSTETFTAKGKLAEIHYSLGNLYRENEDYREAAHHYYMAVALTDHYKAGDILNRPDSFTITTLPLELDNENAWQTQEIPQKNETLFLNGLQYFSGLGVQQNFVKAIVFFKTAADQGHTHAQYQLGWMYNKGLVADFPKNSPETNAATLHWYQRAAEQGFARAQSDLGHMYSMGEVDGFPKGSPQANATAVHWYQRAAEQGDVHGQNSLGRMYLMGKVDGFPENSLQANATAVQWCQLAAEQGNAVAQQNLGYMYSMGKVDGFPENSLQTNAATLHWYQRAAEQGVGRVQNKLAHMYHNGQVEGFPRGSLNANAAAVQWYNRAAEQGHAAAQHNLGHMYSMGEVDGFPTGSLEANATAADWLQRAVNQGLEASQNSLNIVYRRLLATYASRADFKQVNNLLEKKRVTIVKVAKTYQESSLLNTIENLKRLLAFTDNEDLRENLVAKFKQLNTFGADSFTDNLSLILILNNAKLANQFIKRHDLYSYPLQDVKQLARLLSEMIPYFFKRNIPVKIIDICMSFLFSLPVAKVSTVLQQESEIFREPLACNMRTHRYYLNKATLFSKYPPTDLFITKAELTECLDKSSHLLHSKPENLTKLLEQESNDISYKSICTALKEDGITQPPIVDALKEKFDAKLVATASALKK